MFFSFYHRCWNKTITAVFGTMALQLIQIFQCSVTYTMKQTISFFDCCNAFIVCDCSFSLAMIIQYSHSVSTGTSNHGFRKSKTVLEPVNSFLTGAFFLKTTRRICAKLFQGLGVNSCLLQPALNSNVCQ